MAPKRRPLSDRIAEKSSPEPNTGCWLWLGSTTTRGYGTLGVGHHRTRMAHRVSFEAATGRDPGAFDVCHRCDQPACVNPAHLFLGTRTDNMRDCRAKGRIGTPDRSGERNGRARLSVEQVATIRARYAAGGITHRALAREFGVAEPTISHITSGRHWKDTP